MHRQDPGGTVVKTPTIPMQSDLGSPWSGNPKSHMSHGVAKNLKHYLWEFPGGLWLGFQAFTATAQVQSLGRELKIPQGAWHDPPAPPPDTHKQTNLKPKCTAVFAEEIMTTTQVAIKKLCSLNIGEDPRRRSSCPRLSSYPLPCGGGRIWGVNLSSCVCLLIDGCSSDKGLLVSREAPTGGV